MLSPTAPSSTSAPWFSVSPSPRLADRRATNWAYRAETTDVAQQASVKQQRNSAVRQELDSVSEVVAAQPCRDSAAAAGRGGGRRPRLSQLGNPLGRGTSRLRGRSPPTPS